MVGVGNGKALLDGLGELKVKRSAIREKLRKASSKPASLEYPKPVNLEEAKRLFDPGTLFPSFSVGEEKTELFALLGGELKVFDIHVKRKDLEKAIRGYRLLDPSRDAFKGH